ncbi:MAG: N-acetylmuramoyl-L-alanine amidase [Chitinophagaceae bacterium]|nr:N-acetylmuramoyl-L-alanine amidase [Chitinophagaceae bacterium]
MIHEFIADKTAVEGSDTSAFASMILQAAYPQQHFQLTNQFFYSPIKRRLAMITKNNHSKAGYIGRVLVLPLLFITFAAFSFKTNSLNESGRSTYNGKQITVVINAGHGGKDAGAKSITGNLYEKDIVLSITKKIKELNSNKSLNIVYTREDDSYQSPQEIATFANAQNPDLFISIHLSSAESNNDKQSGMDVFVAKDNFSNAEKSKLFASAIINQFTGNYPLPLAPNPQQREQGIWTLQEINCPAVLIEAGYISNEKDLQFLQTDNAKENIARNILIAVEKYASALSGTTKITATEQIQAKAIEAKRKDNSTGTVTMNSEKITVEPIKPAPLYILDGKEEDSTVLKRVNPDNIDRVDVLKGESAVALYGERAKNGIVLITTKKPASPTAQKNDADDKIFTQVENEADFIGGREAWIKYLTSNLDGTIPVKEGWKPGKYNVIVEFIVDKEGNISEVKTANYQGTKTAAHCINLIQKGPKWKPAIQNDHPVKAYRKQPITFIVE